MSARPLALALITIAASTLSACADVTGPTRGSSITPSQRPSLAVSDPSACRLGGWNSSTGRCE
jgi:hypothetical protein